MMLKTTLLSLFIVSQALGLDSTKLAAIHPAMEEAVKAKQAAGVVTLAMENDKVVHHDPAGNQHLSLRLMRLVNHENESVSDTTKR